MKTLLLEPAYILHRRPYRETSVLLDILTQNHGRISVIARGVRKERSSSQGILQPFVPLSLSLAGKGELLTVTHAEVHGERHKLLGQCLYAGFYLNELLTALLEKWDPHPELYKIYSNTLALLAGGVLEERILRIFEKRLLEELGYGLLPKSDISLHNTLLADKYYRFVPEQGFVLSELGEVAQAKTNMFSGKSLLAIAHESWPDEESLQDAKRLTRLVLAPLLGARPLYSRQLFMKPEERCDEK